MKSGNFLIGDGLGMEEFNKNVVPEFDSFCYEVRDKIEISDNERGARKILVSIAKEDERYDTALSRNLEEGVNLALINAGQKLIDLGHQMGIDTCRKLTEYGWDGEKNSISGGKFQTLGVYENEETASELFIGFARKYQLRELEEKIKKIGKETQTIFKR